VSLDNSSFSASLQANTAEAIAADIAHRCANPRKVKHGWQVCCPAHGDDRASLSITPEGEKVLIHCHAGCDYQAILDALHLQPSDLRVNPANSAKPQFICAYAYTDMNGNTIHETVRYAPKDFRQRRPDPVNPGKYIYNLDGITPVLYHLKALHDAIQRGERVYVCEGEKDAKNLAKLGLVATTNAMGADKWRPEYSETLRGAHIVIMQDKDDAGKKRTATITQALTGIAASIKILDLPGLPEKGDVSDWLQAGGTREQLEALAQTVDTSQEKPSAHAVMVTMEDVTERPIEWLWEPYLAIGKLCLLDGDPGTGKTGAASIIAAAVSRGYPLPDQQGKPTVSTGEPGIVLMIAAEDDLEDTLKKRLRLAGADMTKIMVLNEVVTRDQRREHFTLAHLALLEEEVQRLRPRLVYVDNLQLILGSKVDINRANQVNDILEGLISLAARYRFALICTRHPSKPGQNIGRLIHRGMGSQAFMGRARLGLYVEEHPLDPTKSLLIQSKSNAGGFGVTQIFSKAGGHFEWCGVTRINAQTMAGSGRGPEPHAFIEACFWLEEHLQDGYAHDAGHLIELAKEDGIGQKPLYGAKKALQIKSSQVNDGWLWRLPSLEDREDSIGCTGDSGYTGVTGTTGVSDLDTARNASHEEGGQDTKQDNPDTPDTPHHPDTPVVPIVTDDSVDLRVNTSFVTNLSPLMDNDDDFDDLVRHVSPWIHTASDNAFTCYVCKGSDSWLNSGGERKCYRCHKPAVSAVA